MNKPDSPWVFVALGFVVGALAGVFLYLAQVGAPGLMLVLAVIAGAIGSVLLTADAVSLGVENGMARHEWRGGR